MAIARCEPPSPPTDAATVPVSVVVPAWRKADAISKTLRRILECRPAPAEILVHVDGSDPAILAILERDFPEVRVLKSIALVGPGGSRNALVNAARNELVASFDDDSFPANGGYFARVMHDAALFPSAAVISAASHEAEWREPGFQEIAVYSGCGCVFRKSWFQKTCGFVPLAIAYAMEEVDLSLQLLAAGGVIAHDPDLRVVHDHPWPTQLDPAVNAAVVRNTALLPFLRYPLWLAPLGVFQVVRHIARLIVTGSVEGLWQGLRQMPVFIRDFRSFRSTVPGRAVLSWLVLKRHPRRVEGVSESVRENLAASEHVPMEHHA